MARSHSWSVIRAAVIGAFLCSAAPQTVAAQQTLSVYGYMASRYEKLWREPAFEGGRIVRANAPGEFSQPSFNLMLQQEVGPKFKAYVNLSGADAEQVDVRNMWGEVTLSRLVSVRFGKTYRKFGLYNEILDAVPTYYGIEPPEMFDGDHLLLSRTTTLMVHGSADIGPGTFSYSVSNDNGEGDIFGNALPVGIDANYVFGYGSYKIGFSGYSSNGPANAGSAVGDGSPAAGVLPWMAEDDFSVFATYAQAEVGAMTLQFEYAQADHNGIRDVAGVMTVVNSASLNDAQRARFLFDPSGAVTEANVRTSADFSVKTWYVRAGYSIETDRGEFAPYLQWDWYSNPETIAKKTFGGDNEAGVADNGVFNKATLGVVYRPTPAVAVKLDGSTHLYRFHGSDVAYPEIRLDVSYTFGF
jgi:hypothetical protein